MASGGPAARPIILWVGFSEDCDIRRAHCTTDDRDLW